MAAYTNIDGYRDDKYLARSWTIMTRERGWLGRTFLLWLAQLIPIFGPLGVLGYIAERGRLVAWGIPTSPRQSGARAGACIKSGWRVFLVLAAWGLVWGFITATLEALPLLGGLIMPINSLLSVVAGVIIAIAALRATIYQQVGAGFKISTIFQMVENDAAGLLRIMGINLVGSLIVVVVLTVVFFVVLVPSIASIEPYTEIFADMTADEISQRITSDQRSLEAAAHILMGVFVPLLIAAYASSFFSIMLNELIYTALGLWVRQYNVPAWGGNDDPLPIGAPAAQYTQFAQNTQMPYAYGDTDYGQQTHGGVGDQGAYGAQGTGQPLDERDNPPQMPR